VTPPRQYLLDTNVLSETRKRRPDEAVLAFLEAAEPSLLFISVLALGEFRKGVVLKMADDSEGAKAIGSWVDGLEHSFADRFVGIDAATARLWGELSAQRSRPVVDTLLAATAIVHHLTLVTRNEKDVMDVPSLLLLNPWTSKA
jgi:predicted nucleic acid-binding protein